MVVNPDPEYPMATTSVNTTIRILWIQLSLPRIEDTMPVLAYYLTVVNRGPLTVRDSIVICGPHSD